MFTISNDLGAIHAFALALDAGLKFAALVFAALGHHSAPFAHALVVSLAAILIVVGTGLGTLADRLATGRIG